MTRTGPKRTFNPNPKELSDLYQQMSMKCIAEHYGVGETVVFKRIKEHGITLEGVKGGHRCKTGIEFTEEHKNNLSKALTGKLAGKDNPNWKGGEVEKICGWCGDVFLVRNGSDAKYCSYRCKGKSQLSETGESNRNWKGGRPQSRRNTTALKTWKRLALERANGKCEECGVKGGNACECCGQRTDLHVHHIKSWNDYPELRHELDNAKVLCTSCHRKVHKSHK